jgi:hypothetical protein
VEEEHVGDAVAVEVCSANHSYASRVSRSQICCPCELCTQERSPDELTGTGLHAVKIMFIVAVDGLRGSRDEAEDEYKDDGYAQQ